jgi:geranylgeranyl pyrophosphate synthase
MTDDNRMATSFLHPVKDRLAAVEAHMRLQAEDAHPDLGAALTHLIDAGGKRVRPIVTILTGELLDAPEDRLLDLAAAVELLHTATLVHDDMIDGALLRRGMPTLNAGWTPAATILTGDFIFARAAKLASATGSVAVMDMFAEALTIIVDGEIRQQFTSKGLANLDDYYHRIYAKTASLFELASGAAALLAPVSAEKREMARRFGYEIGMAFQIMDDVLDYSAAQSSLGKPVGSDLRNGLLTLPALLYHEAHPTDPDILSVIRRNGHPAGDIDALVARIRASDAVNQAVEEAEQFVQRALTLLEGLPATPHREGLEDLARYIVTREY